MSFLENLAEKQRKAAVTPEVQASQLIPTGEADGLAGSFRTPNRVNMQLTPQFNEQAYRQAIQNLNLSLRGY